MSNDDSYPTEYTVPPRTRPGALWVGLVRGTPTTGLWCDTCLLPSRYEVSLYVLGDDGPIRVGFVNRCDGCMA